MVRFWSPNVLQHDQSKINSDVTLIRWPTGLLAGAWASTHRNVPSLPSPALWCSPAARQWSQVPGCLTEWRPAVVEARPVYHSQGQQHAGSSTAQSSPLPRKTERTCLHLTCSVSLGILCSCVGSIQNHWPTCTGVSPKASCQYRWMTSSQEQMHEPAANMTTSSVTYWLILNSIRTPLYLPSHSGIHCPSRQWTQTQFGIKNLVPKCPDTSAPVFWCRTVSWSLWTGAELCLYLNTYKTAKDDKTILWNRSYRSFYTSQPWS